MNRGPAPRLADRLRTILVPTDYSAAAGHALDHAEQIARQTGARLVLLHVFDDADYIVSTALGLAHKQPEVEAYRAEMHRQAESSLRSVAAGVAQRGLAVDAVISEGPSACRITQAAGEYRADLVVLAARGRTGWRARSVGTVAEQVVRYSPCPVLVVLPHRPEMPADELATGLRAPPLNVRHLLVATDFSDDARQAVQLARDIALEAGAELTLLHAMLPQEYAVGQPDFGPHGTGVETIYETIRDAAARVVEEECAQLEALGVRAEPLLLRGLASDRIVEAARASGAGLIVLAAQGVSAWSLALLGSTAQRVLHAAPCPVLIVRQPAHCRLAEPAAADRVAP